MTTSDAVALQARLGAARTALCDLDHRRRLTFGELDDAVARCARVLLDRGCGAGDRVAVVAPNQWALVVLHYACTRVGAVYTPLNTRLAPAEIKTLIERTAPTLTVCDANPSLDLAADFTCATLNDAIERATPIHTGVIDVDRPSLMLFTSGTSGAPKGVLLSERNLTESAINFTWLGRVTPESVFLCDAPMFHVIGLVNNIRTPLMNGATCLLSAGFDPQVTLSRLSDPELRVTHYFGVPQMLHALRALPEFRPEPLRRLTGIFSGGAPHAPDAIRAWLNDGITVVEGYGMTEVGCVFGMPLDRNLLARNAGAVGVASPRVQTRIVDASGDDCGVGVVGQLWVRGDNVFVGYLGEDPRGDDAPHDGWFRTGDLCTVDESGLHRIVDRCKDMYISGGENVYPAEVEAALAGMVGVRDAAVIGVPDERWGEVGMLAFVGDANAPSPEAIVAYLRERIAAFKIPKHITRVDALPRTPSGKLKKQALRATLTPAT